MNDLFNQSPFLFIYKNQILNEKGEPLNFCTHRFMIDIIKDMTPEQVIMKAAQVGMTITMSIKGMWICKYLGYNIIYSMPSDSDIQDFVPSKVDRIIKVNPVLREMLFTDKQSLKQIGDRFIHFKGTISKSAPISTTADLLIHDEVDRSDEKAVEFYRSRIGKSKYRGIWKLSNPSTFGHGVDADWQRSDQKEWVITCSCGKEQFLVWEHNVDYEREKYICSKCGKPLTKTEILSGKWIAQKPENKISGYHISQMMCVWIPCRTLIEEKKTRGDEYFYNFVLGLPYQPGDNPISKALITDLLTTKVLETKNWYLGVDVGNVKHYVLGSEKGVVQIGQFTDWDDFQKMIDRYKPTTVIDGNPFHDIVKHFVNSNKGVYMVEYRTDKTGMETKKWGDFSKSNERGIVWIDTNRVIDETIDVLLRGNIEISTGVGDKLVDLIKHTLTLKKVKKENSMGIEKYEWESSTGVDHYFQALKFYLLAVNRGGHSIYFGEQEPRNKDQYRIERGWSLEEVKKTLAIPFQDYISKED